MLLIVAFSLGLALTITGIGLLAVFAKRAFGRFDLNGGLIRFLPAVSALVIVLAGVAMTARAIPTAPRLRRGRSACAAEHDHHVSCRSSRRPAGRVFGVFLAIMLRSARCQRRARRRGAGEAVVDASGLGRTGRPGRYLGLCGRASDRASPARRPRRRCRAFGSPRRLPARRGRAASRPLRRLGALERRRRARRDAPRASRDPRRGRRRDDGRGGRGHRVDASAATTRGHRSARRCAPRTWRPRTSKERSRRAACRWRTSSSTFAVHPRCSAARTTRAVSTSSPSRTTIRATTARSRCWTRSGTRTRRASRPSAGASTPPPRSGR